VTPVLLDPGAAALNQNDRDDDTKHGSGNTNDRGGFHIGSPFSQNGASIDVPSPQYFRSRAAELAHFCGAPRRSAQANLLGVCAAALNNDAEYDGTEHGSGNANDCGGFHSSSPFSQNGASIDVPSSQYLVAGQRSSRIFAAPPEDPRRPHYLALVRRR